MKSNAMCLDLSYHPMGAKVAVKDRSGTVVARIDEGNVVYLTSLSQEQKSAIQKFAERS